MDLGPADVHVWTVALGGAPAYGDIFSADEKARAARLVRPEDRAHFLAAHGALRTVLARYVAAAPRAIELAAGPWGKPALAGALAASGVTFNLAHSGALALIAVARRRAVGIDVEVVRPMPEAAGIARRMLGASAAAAVERLDPPLRDETFLRLWTAQEACIKALGLALAVASESVRVGLAGGDPVCEWVDPGATPHGLAVAPFATDSAHLAALAWVRRAARPADDPVAVARFAYPAEAADS